MPFYNMKKCTAKKNTQSNTKNTKITSFFTKYQSLAKTQNPSANSSSSHADDDIVENSPVKIYPKKGPPAAILEDVTNTSDTPPNPNEKKRKISGKYSDENPDDFEVESPVKKKPCVPKEFDDCQIEKERSKQSKENVEKGVKTPEKKGCAVKGTDSWTPSPSKKLSPSRNGCTMQAGGGPGKRTPAKRSPKKLFEMSPNVSEFKVEVLDNFVKITPSKSQQSGVSSRNTPVKSAEKKQGSILQFASPCTPKRSLEAQFSNEKTPDHKPTPRCQTPSSKVKMKLDFTLTNALVTVFKQDRDSSAAVPSGTDNVNVCAVRENSPKENGDADDVDNFFNDSWEDNFQFTANYALDLSQSQHCKILEITKTDFKQTILVQSTKSEDRAVCTLTDFWANVTIEVGCTVHVTAVQDKLTSEWVISNNEGLLVYEPDFLISSTSIVGALFCKRRSVLKDRFAGFDPGNKVMLVGTLVHSLLQTCLRNEIQDAKEIAKVVEDLLTSREIVFELFQCSLTRSEIETEINIFIPRIITFMQQYLRLNLGKYPVNTDKNNWKGRIDSIQDIEENIWCPELGIKGKVDVSAKVQGSIMPLELKTGRATMSLEHRGQIVLYIMMMNKLGYKVPSGLLLYLREGVVRDISMIEREKRDLMILRNELAYYLTRQPKIIEQNESTHSSDTSINSNLEKMKSDLLPVELPPPINHHSACGKCEYNTLCCLYLKHNKTDLSEYRSLSTVRDVIVSHLEKIHTDYFVHWSSLLALENGAPEGKQLREIYTKSPEERQKNGKCIINTIIISKVSDCNSLYSTTFGKEDSKLSNFLSSGIGESSYVVVSRDQRPAVAAGLVSHIDHRSITVELDRDLSKKYPGSTFHLDTYDSSSINTFNLTNLSILMEPTERAGELRKLIIEKAKPTFRKTLPSEVGKKSGPILKRMNKMQQRAVIKALAANDYLLIKGMPGTGKTATIVALVQFLVELNYSVLITSHTNSAVDNVCIRLQDCGINVLRLGAESRIHPKLRSRSEHALTKHCKTPEELELVYNSSNILAATCIGSKHPILSKRVMDVCIVDESTQVLQTSVFRPLYASKKFILIGDPDQLPPIVRNREALARGLSESLFDRLQSPESVVTLSFNYRMNRVITSLANDLTYKGQLLIANDTVANANLRLPKFESLMVMYRERQWVLQALDDDLKKSVCILDTGPVWNKVYRTDWIQRPAIEKEGEEVVLSCVNPSEVAVIVYLVRALIKGGHSPSRIGIIAPYRAQISQISSILQGSGVDVSTVDQFQGQDKEVILYSCTKSRDLTKPHKVSKFEILEDKRRLTVAVTRAKHKLIIVADVATIREYSPFCKLFSCVGADHCMRLIDGDSGFSWEQVIEDCGQPNN